MQNLNERGAAYIPIAEARGITPHSDNAPKDTHINRREAAVYR